MHIQKEISVSLSPSNSASVVLPELETVVQILPHGIRGGEDGRQRLQVHAGHPDGQCRVALSEPLPTRDTVAVTPSDETPHPELHSAPYQRSHRQPYNAAPVALAMQEYEIDGLPDGDH